MGMETALWAVFVFCGGGSGYWAIPLLYQIKDASENDFSAKEELCDRYCRALSLERGWEYSVIYPKTMPNSDTGST
ncbi:hypothetical protein SAMN03159341_13617 [Paenibacillus sp. 1_12]|nr:hypothetical protein SAMN03159341_13617 [Paenibacillus sp. 1_12]